MLVFFLSAEKSKCQFCFKEEEAERCVSWTSMSEDAEFYG
jgi:hypothetical protein